MNQLWLIPFEVEVFLSFEKPISIPVGQYWPSRMIAEHHVS